MSFDPTDVAHKVHDVGAFLRADGADLTLVEADPGTARIRVRLELVGANCEECVLPPPALRSTIEFALQRELHTEFELVLEDPRTA